jgi:hypothetical protein
MGLPHTLQLQGRLRRVIVDVVMLYMGQYRYMPNEEHNSQCKFNSVIYEKSE